MSEQPGTGQPVETTPVAGGEEEASSAAVFACFVRIGGRVFAALARHCEEVIQISSLIRVPRAPSYLLGVVHTHGRVLPVIEARRQLALEPKKAVSRGEALVVATGETRAAIVVEEVLGFEPIEPEALRVTSANSGVPPGLALGAVRRRGEDALILDVERLLSSMAIAF